MTDEVTTVRSLRERIDVAYTAFSDTISGLSDEEVVAPDTIGSWSVRDMIAHISGDELWMAGQLEALRSETVPTAASCYGIDVTPPDDMDWSQDGRNAWQRQRLKGLSLEDVRAMAIEAHRRLLAVISTFDDAQLADPLAIANLGTTAWIRPPEDGDQAYPLWEWIRGVTYHHYDDHAKDVRNAALKG